MALGYDGSIRIKALLNHNEFDRGIRSMGDSVKSLQGTLMKLAGAVGIALGTAALVKFGKESVKLASDVQEAQNVIDVTFGRGAAQVEEFAKSAAEAFGLSELSAKQYTGTLGAMLKSSGLVTKDAQEMSIALSGLARDIASFYNLDTDTAFEKIRSGISGETEPLRQLGINMSVANLEAYALSKGITKSYNAMSQAEQVLLRYNYLLSVTADAQGDFARTSGSFANQIRILQLNFDQLKIAMGNAIIPIAQAVLPGINAIIAALTKLARVFAQVTALLFGKKSTSGSSGQVKEQEAIASSGSAAADATDKLADATAGAGEASKKAAKDMKGVLAGFDELNILADRAASSVSGAAGGIGDVGAGDVDIPESDDMDGGAILEIGEAFKSLGEIFRDTLDDMLAGIPRLREAFMNFADSFNDFNKKLYDAFKFDGVLERVELLGRELAKAFNDLVNAIDWELWGRTLGAELNLGLQFLTEFIYTFDWVNLGKKLSDFINGLVYEVDWYDFGRLLWAQFKIGLETFAGFFTGLDMPALAKAASDIIIGFFDEMKATIARIDWEEIGKQIAEFLNNIKWGEIFASVWGAIKEAIFAGFDLLAGVIKNGSPELLLAASAIAATLGAKFAKDLVPKITGVAGTISSAFKKLTQVFEIANNSVYTFSEAMTMVFGPGSIIAGISAVIGGIALALTSFFSMWNSGFSAAKEAVMLVGIAVTTFGEILLGVSAPIALTVGGIVAVLGTLAASIHGAGKAAYEESEDFQTMERILDECEDSSKRSATALDTLKGNIDNLSTSMSDISAAQSLVEEIYAINENANASAYELELMAIKIDLLNSMGLEGLHLTIDETTGRIVETKEATDQLILSLQKEAETAALQELLVQAYKDRYQAVSDAEQAVKNIDAAEQALKDTEEQLTNTPWWDLEKHAALTEQQKKQTEALEAATDARDNAITAYDELSGAIDTYAGSLTNLSEPEANVGVQLESRMDSVRKTVEGVAADMPGYGKDIGEGLEKGMDEGVDEKKTKGIFGRIGDWFRELFEIHSPSKVFAEYGSYLMTGLSNGINENLPPIGTTLSGFLKDTESKVSTAWSNVEKDTSSKWGSIEKDLVGKYSTINTESDTGFQTIKDTIISKIEATMEGLLGKDWLSIGRGIVDGVMDGLKSIFEKLRSWASDVWSSITSAFSSRSITPSYSGGRVSVSTGYRTANMIPESYSARNLPRLANGAVIPPNQQFAAILGDQRSGTNLEAPGSLVRQLVAEGVTEAIRTAGGLGNTGNMTVIMEIDGREFGRASYKYGTAERQRVGVRLTEVRT